MVETRPAMEYRNSCDGEQPTSCITNKTYHSVGTEQRPLETVPAKLGLMFGLETALAELEHESIVIVDDTSLTHTGGVGRERVTTTTLLGAAMSPVTLRVELCELGGNIVDRQGTRTVILLSTA
jgi:hypothetical protein